MNIAEAISARTFNGAVRVCLQTCNALAERGNNVVLLHRPELDPGPWLDKAIVRIPTSFRFAPSELRRVAALLKAQHIEVIHSHSSDAQTYGAILKRIWGLRSVATAHAGGFSLHWRQHDRLIFPTRATLDYHRRVNRISAAKAHVVPNFLADGALKLPGTIDRAVLRERLGLPRDAFVAVSVGDVDSRKRQSILVGAIKHLVAGGIDAHLVLIGRETYPPESEKIALLSQGIAGRIHLLGFRPDAVELLGTFDVYALASSDEQLPMAMMEAMAAGLPVVSTDVGGIAEIVRDDETGFLMPADVDDIRFAQTLGRLAREPSLIARLGATARTVVLDFAGSGHIKDVERIFAEAIGRR